MIAIKIKLCFGIPITSPSYPIKNVENAHIWKPKTITNRLGSHSVILGVSKPKTT